MARRLRHRRRGDRRARGRRDWLDSALSRTWLPVLLVAVFFVIAGRVCQWYTPGATTLAEVFRNHLAR